MRQIIVFLLALLGVSCDGGGLFGGGVCEYGTPHSYFEMKARVVDENGNPIQGIETRSIYGPQDEYGEPFENKMGFSDYLGYIDATTLLIGGAPEYLRFIDRDGELNGGKFETLDMDISDKVVKIKDGDGNWNAGTYSADLGDVVMKLETETPEEDNTENEK